MKRFLNWLADTISPEKASPKVARYRPDDSASPPRKPSKAKTAKPKKPIDSDFVEFDASIDGKIDTVGPGKNVLRRPRFVREEAGTHETLSIVDEAGEQQRNEDDEDGIDPYNTGRFDRSKNWDKRFRKD